MSTISNYSEETGYVDIFGNDVKVFVCERTAVLLVPIEEVRKIGFKLYRKNQYNRLLIDESQFLKEFQLYMLGAARSYSLEKQFKFSELEIVESINKCKEVLMGGGDTSNIAPSPRDANTISQNPTGGFIKNHKITLNDSITVTTSVSEPSQSVPNMGGFSQFRSPAYVASSGNRNRNAEQHQQKAWDDVNLELRQPLSRDHNNSFSRENKKGTRSPASSEERRSLPSFSNTPRDNSSSSRQSNSSSFNSRNERRPRESRGPRNFNAFQDRHNGFKNEPLREKLKHIELTKPEHTVLVTFVEKDTSPIAAWVQDVDNGEIAVDIDTKVKIEAAKPTKYAKYCLNKIFLGQHEDSWYRCKIIKFKPLTVFFVDFGNTSEVKTVREASEELDRIPCQAVKITSQSAHKIEVFQKLIVKVKSRIPNGTYVVDLKPASQEPSPSPTTPTPTPPPAKAPPSPKSPVFFAKSQSSRPTPTPPPPPAPAKAPPSPKTAVFFAKSQSSPRLTDADKVMILGQDGANLAVRCRESYEKLREIEMELANVETNPVESVEKGQLVLCKRGKLERVVVVDVKGKTVEVEFMDDYLAKMEVDLSSLSHITESLAKEGPTFIRTPEIKGYQDGCEEIIKEFINSKAKFTVVLQDGDFDLQMGEELLSEKFTPGERYPDRPMLAKFDFYQPKLGTATYTLQTFRDINNLTFMDNDALEDHLQDVFLEEVPEGAPYEPVEGEVCYGWYQGNWFRCVVQRVMTTGYEVKFLDFGNVEVLNSDQLREYAGNAEGVLILGIPCVLTGLPPVRNIEELILSNLIEGEAYKINIKKYNPGIRAYEIEIPSVYEQIDTAA